MTTTIPYHDYLMKALANPVEAAENEAEPDHAV